MAFDPPLPSVLRARRQPARALDLAMERRIAAYRVLLVPVMGDPADEAALRMARLVSEQTQAHIIGLHVRSPVAALVPAGVVDQGRLPPVLVNRLNEAERNRSAAALERFQCWQRQCGIGAVNSPMTDVPVTAEWIDIEAPVAEGVARQARAADLVVVARSPRAYAAARDDVLHGALLGSGRPSLIVPGDTAESPFETVVIAWNDSREAARAIAAAWSLIARARRIVVFVGSRDKDAARSAERLTAHLAWHSAAPTVVVGDPSDDAGAALLAVARRERAGLIVMGAYTYGRLRRLVFGDATGHVLAHATIPVLMAL